jgi:carbon storage regulator
MLVLTRRTEESLLIGENIVVTVLGVEGEKVKLGIEAPREVPILRRELLDAINQQNRLAQKLSPGTPPPAINHLRDLLSAQDPNSENPAAPAG